MDKFSISSFNNFFEAVLQLKNLEEAHKFFEDICTIKELDSLSQRLEVADMLKSGKNYQEITRATGASTATISRVNRCLKYGDEGYLKVLENIERRRGR